MEILGLLDSLEAIILDGFKIPMTKKTIINEEQVLILIDKIRLVIQGGSDFAKKAIDKDRGRMMANGGSSQQEPPVKNIPQQTIVSEKPTLPSDIQISPEKEKSTEIIQQAYQLAKQIREGADNYADEVLSNLELTSSRILRTIKAGRERLDKNVQGRQTPEKINV